MISAADFDLLTDGGPDFGRPSGHVAACGRTGREMVGARGFEPPTSRSRTVRATRLRYAPTRRALLYRVVGPAQGCQASQAYLPTSLTNLQSPQGRVFISPWTFSTTVRVWFATSPTGTTMRPPSPSCWNRGGGIDGPPAVTRMRSNWASSGQPKVPLPTRTQTLS